MIISNKYKFIFIAIPKTGTTSIETVLSKKKDLQVSNSNIYTKEKLNKHLSAEQLKRILGHKKFNSYYKFAFVRNPWEMLVSKYLFEKRYVFGMRGTFSKYKNDWQISVKKARELSFKEYLFYFKDSLRNYESYISNKKGQNLINYIGKLETVQEDFDKICNRIGIEKMKLPHLNKFSEPFFIRFLPNGIRLIFSKLVKPKKASYTQYYDQESKELVYRIYKKDIRKFNYKFDI